MTENNGMELQLDFTDSRKNVRFETTHAVGIKVIVYWDVSKICVPKFQRNHEEGDSRYLLNIGTHLPNSMASHLRDHNLEAELNVGNKFRG